MRLTAYTDYSLRVLMYLALRPDPMPTISEIASVHRVSKNHLMKVAYELGQAGYIETVRGRNGGLRLARRPEDIVVGEVIRHTEPDMTLVPCFDQQNAPCAITNACKLRSALRQAGNAFLAVLDAYTLADLVENPVPLNQLLTARMSAAEPAPAPKA